MQTELKTALGPDDPDDGTRVAVSAASPSPSWSTTASDPDRFGYKVPSQSGKGTYLVNLGVRAVLHLPRTSEERSALQARLRRPSVDPGRTSGWPNRRRRPSPSGWPQTPWQQYNRGAGQRGRPVRPPAAETCATPLSSRRAAAPEGVRCRWAT